MLRTIHVVHFADVGPDTVLEFEGDETLEPPVELIVAVAPGIYYRYANPTLVPDTEIA